MRPRIVALGGGHGLATVLAGLAGLDVELTAVVTVADDGGSSGRIRASQPHLLPPGDLRMALAAVAAPPWAPLLQHRMSGGDLDGHPVGNLLLAGLQDAMGEPVAAIAAVATAIGACATVLPLSTQPLVVQADLEDGRTVHGQVRVATATRRVLTMRLVPERPPVPPEVLTAISAADLVVLGPGSLWTSVVVHLLVPEVRAALMDRRVVHVLNLVSRPGEDGGLGPADQLAVVCGHGVTPAVVVADATCLASAPEQQLARLNAGPWQLVTSPVAARPVPRRTDTGHDEQPELHDPVRLARVIFSLVDPSSNQDTADSRVNTRDPTSSLPAPGTLEDHAVQSTPDRRAESTWSR
jgi:uncharacterized cofD-like protein